MTEVDASHIPSYDDKVYGCWLGKNIGGTLGGPLEGKMELLSYNFYPKLGDLPLANDDLDLQLVWLHALETYGPQLTARELTQEWLDHVFFPYDEYGYALTNMRRGMEPPVSGWFCNPFTHCMGSPIRSEIWALACPGKPGLASFYAYQDAITDHAGGEGVYGEMFFAAIESAAFVESNPEKLIRTGLSLISPDSRTAQAVLDTLTWYALGLSWMETRKEIIRKHGRQNFTDAPQNIAFTILGWLYGEDFGDCLCKAVNCGYDTDCTGATLGAILGIIGGAKQIPPDWADPLGNGIAVSAAVNGFPAPANLTELTERTITVAQEMQHYWERRLSPDLRALWSINPRQNRYSVPPGSTLSPSLEVVVDYGPNGPITFPSQETPLQVKLTNHSTVKWYGNVHLSLPAGCSGGNEQAYCLVPGESQCVRMSFTPGPDPQPTYQVDLVIERLHNGALWHATKQPLVWAQAMRWVVETPDAITHSLICPTNRIPFDQITDMPNGKYTLHSSIVCPEARQGKLLLATHHALGVVIDGRTVDENWQPKNSIPAYHRGSGIELNLSQGIHPIIITAEKHENQPLELLVAFTATRRVTEPGAFFSFLDVMFI